MRTMSARDAKNGFGLLIDVARVEPVTIEKHGRPVVVVISVEEFQRMNVATEGTTRGASRGNGRRGGKSALQVGR